MNKIRQFILLTLGAVVALLIVVSQVGYYHLQYSLVDSQRLEMGDDGQKEENGGIDFQVFSNDAISTIITVNLQQGLHFIHEICLEPIENVGTTFEKLVHPSKYFLTLFRRIISPNAP